MKLDLHGVKHENVIRVVDTFIWENMQRGETQLIIVTGKSTPMKNIVQECLNDYDIIAQESFDGGSLIINL
jgi:DNA-nicking Smr family endonuclease